MNAEQLADLIEKFIDAKISLDATSRSQTVAKESRQLLMDSCKKTVTKTKASLIEALKQHDASSAPASPS